MAVGGGDDKRWRYEAAMAHPPASVVQVTSQAFYLFGACSDRQSTVHRYDFDLNKWTQLEGNIPCSDSGIIVFQNRIWFVGGKIREIGQQSVHSFGSSDVRWRVEPPINQVRYDLGVAVFQGRLYAIGGCHVNCFGKEEILKSTEVYEPGSPQWNSHAMMCTQRTGHGVAASQWAIYVAGGYSSASQKLNTVECYTSRTNGWTLLAVKLRRKRSQCCTVTYGGLLFLLGSDMKGNVEVYPPPSARRIDVAKLPGKQRCFVVGAKHKGKIYTVIRDWKHELHATFYSFDLASGEWTELQTPISNVPLYAAKAVVYDKAITNFHHQSIGDSSGQRSYVAAQDERMPGFISYSDGRGHERSRYHEPLQQIMYDPRASQPIIARERAMEGPHNIHHFNPMGGAVLGSDGRLQFMPQNQQIGQHVTRHRMGIESRQNPEVLYKSDASSEFLSYGSESPQNALELDMETEPRPDPDALSEFILEAEMAEPHERFGAAGSRSLLCHQSVQPLPNAGAQGYHMPSSEPLVPDEILEEVDRLANAEVSRPLAQAFSDTNPHRSRMMPDLQGVDSLNQSSQFRIPLPRAHKNFDRSVLSTVDRNTLRHYISSPEPLSQSSQYEASPTPADTTI